MGKRKISCLNHSVFLRAAMQNSYSVAAIHQALNPRLKLLSQWERPPGVVTLYEDYRNSKQASGEVRIPTKRNAHFLRSVKGDDHLKAPGMSAARCTLDRWAAPLR
jgi:hypothetical protein